MKRKLIICIILLMLLSMFAVNYADDTKTVLLSGQLIGFKISEYEDNIQENNYVPTSSKSFGTVTFIEKETNRFVSLGHSISKNNDSSVQGECYDVDFLSIYKSQKNAVGQLIAKVNEEEYLGKITENTSYGISGIINSVDEDDYQEIETSNRYQIEFGDAEMLIDFDGKGLKSYSVKIIGINYFSDNKNIKIKVTDEKLIEETGGIVQGMSGAPVIQNGKLIGAINYANSSNPEEAYAIFIDKLI